MNENKITEPQQVNACTPISIGVIHAIVNNSDEKKRQEAIVKAHSDYQEKYKNALSGNEKFGGGFYEDYAYEEYFSEAFLKPQKKTLKAPVDSIDIDGLLETRDEWLKGKDILGFFQWNNQLILMINEKVKPIDIDWSKITAAELKLHLKIDNELSFKNQFENLIQSLPDPAGFTLNNTEGHTISFAKKDKVFYSFDSITGILSSTNNLEEMSTHLHGKMNKNKAKAVIIYTFIPSRALELTPKKQETNTKRQEPTITIELVKKFIVNRKSFSMFPQSYELFEQHNYYLINQIALELSKKNINNYNLKTITEDELCQLLGLQQEPSNFFVTSQNNSDIFDKPVMIQPENIVNQIDEQRRPKQIIKEHLVSQAEVDFFEKLEFFNRQAEKWDTEINNTKKPCSPRRKAKLTPAIIEAQKLYSQIKPKAEDFFKVDQNDVAKTHFKKVCTEAITAALPELKKHRSTNKGLANLVLALVTLGIGFLIAGLINLAATKGKHFLFFNTASEKGLERLDEQVNWPQSSFRQLSQN